jgi:DNA-binding IclR family transcriptional regulator
LDDILDFLSTDGKWHTVRDIAAALHLTDAEVRKALELLGTLGLVTFNGEKVVIDPRLREIMMAR